MGQLQRLGKRKTEWRTPKYSRECFHLSRSLPDEGDGHHACSHELHRVTTRDACRKCPDYEPSLKVGEGAVSSWAVGVITAPRSKPTLARTLRSLAAAGWANPMVFADAGTKVPRSLVPNERLIRRTERYFGWGNWFSMLNELLIMKPDADAYLLVEDDVLFCKGLRPYLERSLWPAERLGFVSLYAASHQDPGGARGFFDFDGMEGLWGSLAFVFPNATARVFVRHPRVVSHRTRGPRSGEADQDIVAGMWAANVGLPIYLHTPSLTQHIGETSAIWGEAASADGDRAASTFPGEDKDIDRMMAGIQGAKKRQRPTP